MAAFLAAATAAIVMTPTFAGQPTAGVLQAGRRYWAGDVAGPAAWTPTRDRRRHAQGPWLAVDLCERDGDGRGVPGARWRRLRPDRHPRSRRRLPRLRGPEDRGPASRQGRERD